MSKHARKTKKGKRQGTARPRALIAQHALPGNETSTPTKVTRPGDRQYDVITHDGEAAFVLVPVHEYESWIKQRMVEDAVSQIEKHDDERNVDARDFALELAAENITEARKRAGLTQKQLGQKLGIPQSQVSRIERYPDHTTVRTMKRLAKALGVDVSVFLRAASG